MKVIGTAGHIDHGKSALVERLTGIDPDRLAEEKRRGMTIDLGFAPLRLPSGDVVSMVDVPGHERFVGTMLAGAGGVHVALIVVAADEGVMPQTREHVQILDLLGIESAVVALTRIDLVDEEMALLAGDEVRALLAGCRFAGCEIVPVSSLTGEGIEDLVIALERALGESAEPRLGHAAYLPIDRAFTVAGFGTVVTGTLHGGSLHSGMEIEVLPEGLRARIRGLQSHREQRSAAEAGMRIAVNLAGVDRTRLGRGQVVAPVGAIRPVTRVDTRVRVLPNAPFPLRHGMEVMLHLGAQEHVATISVLCAEQIEPGHEGWLQLRMPESAVAVAHQAFILRLPAPVRTVAGGLVIDLAPRHRRFDPAALRRLEGTDSTDPSARLMAVLSDDRPYQVPRLAELVGVDQAQLIEHVETAVRAGGAALYGDTCSSRSAWEAIGARTAALVKEYHRDNPLRQGIAREDLRRRLRVRMADWPAALAMLSQAGIIAERGPLLAASDWQIGLATREVEVERVMSALRAQPFAPPSGAELLAATGTDRSLLTALVETGEIVRLSEGIYLDAEAYKQMCAEVLRLINTGESVSVAQVRDALGTTRKYALALLEHLDDERITRRQGDVRVMGSRRPACV